MNLVGREFRIESEGASENGRSFFMLKIRKTTKSGGLKALESLAKEADRPCADVGITSKSNTKRDNVSMAQIGFSCWV